MNYSRPTEFIIGVVNDARRAVFLFGTTVFGAIMLGFLIATGCFNFVGEQHAGDALARGAKESWMTVITSARIARDGSILITTADTTGTRDVILADVSALPDRGPEYQAWRERTLAEIERRWRGARVGCFAANERSSLPSVVHVADTQNTWLNGTLVEEGWVYVPAHGTSALATLRRLQRDAQQAGRGVFAWLSANAVRTNL